MAPVYTSADQLIGHTPLLELTHIEKCEGLSAKVLVKLEYSHPPLSRRIDAIEKQLSAKR